MIAAAQGAGVYMCSLGWDGFLGPGKQTLHMVKGKMVLKGVLYGFRFGVSGAAWPI